MKEKVLDIFMTYLWESGLGHTKTEHIDGRDLKKISKEIVDLFTLHYNSKVGGDTFEGKQQIKDEIIRLTQLL